MITFAERAPGIVVASVSNSRAKAEISLYGAHVLSYRPTGQKDVLFLSEKSFFSPGKPVRGGIPVCFPWFGPHAKDAALPSHGFARLSQWTLERVEETEGLTTLALTLSDTEATRKLWPSPFSLTLEIAVGQSLEMTMTTANTGKKPFTVSDALHTYYNVKNLGKVTVLGLDKASYIDKNDGFRPVRQSGPVAIENNTDRVYQKPNGVTLSDPGFGRDIRIEKKAFPETVIWNPHAEHIKTIADLAPGEYRNMICVEAAAVLDDSFTVEPGKSVKQKMTVTSTPHAKQ
jgi:glucose-6-phosphate 1-epimerase